MVRNKPLSFVVYLITGLKLRGIMTHTCLFLSINYKEGVMWGVIPMVRTHNTGWDKHQHGCFLGWLKSWKLEGSKSSDTKTMDQLKDFIHASSLNNECPGCSPLFPHLWVKGNITLMEEYQPPPYCTVTAHKAPGQSSGPLLLSLFKYINDGLHLGPQSR